MQNLNLLLDFLTNSSDAATADKLGLLKPFSKFLSIYFFIASVFCSDNDL